MGLDAFSWGASGDCIQRGYWLDIKDPSLPIWRTYPTPLSTKQPAKTKFTFCNIHSRAKASFRTKYKLQSLIMSGCGTSTCTCETCKCPAGECKCGVCCLDHFSQRTL